MSISRRTFLAGGLGLLSLYMSPSQILTMAAQAGTIARRGAKSKILVVVQMGGGNDGLNTVVPFELGRYYQLRPNLAIKQDNLLTLNKEVAFNNNLTGLHELFQKGKVAVVQGVGYANPNRSHFRSVDIWQTAQPDTLGKTGWLGRYLDLKHEGKRDENIFSAVNVEPTLPKTLLAEKVLVPSVSNVYEFKFRTYRPHAEDRAAQLAAFNDVYEHFDVKRANVDLLRQAGVDANRASEYLNGIVSKYKGEVVYPDGSYGNGLRFIAQMITGGVDSSIYTVNLDGFDTHTNQLRAQNNLLRKLSDGLAAFYKDLELHGLQDDVMVLAFSEFGRRVQENGSRGTDHGTAAPVFVIGGKVNGGVYGDHPSLSNLDDGDLKYNIDFRQVYTTLLDKWLGADSREILGQSFDSIRFI